MSKKGGEMAKALAPIVRQGNTSVAQGETAVLLFDGLDTATTIAVKTMNFLRSGCPMVQILLTGSPTQIDENLISDRTKAIKNELGTLQCRNEMLHFSYAKPRLMNVWGIPNGAAH